MLHLSLLLSGLSVGVASLLCDALNESNEVDEDICVIGLQLNMGNRHYTMTKLKGRGVFVREATLRVTA